MKLCFGSFSSIISTILIVGIMVYIWNTISKRSEINSWGKKIALLALWGLLICIFASTRDGYVQSVQASMDTKVLPGVFTADSIQSVLCSIGGAVIAFSSLSSIFVKRQGYRKVMFNILSAAIVFKVLVIEISRLFII